MERIIKFRAKMTDGMAESVNCDGDRWVQGFYYKKQIGGKLVSIITDGAHEFEVDESTICQFTGLLDKNGKEIYDGDIVNIGRVANKYNVISSVEYTRSSFMTKDYWPISKYAYQCEVIGNIYDNTELLEE